MPMKAWTVITKQGKTYKAQISTIQPLQDIEYFRESNAEHRIIIDLDYWGG